MNGHSISAWKTNTHMVNLFITEFGRNDTLEYETEYRSFFLLLVVVFVFF